MIRIEKLFYDGKDVLCCNPNISFLHNYIVFLFLIVCHYRRTPFVCMVPNDYFRIKQIACQKDRNNAFRHKKRGIFVEKPLEKKAIGNVPAFLLRSPIYIYRLKDNRKSKNLEIHSVWFGASTEYD